MNMYFFIWFNQETNYVLFSCSNQGIHLFLRHSQGVAHTHTGRGIVLKIGYFLTLGIQFFRSIESNVCLAVIQQLLYVFLIDIATFRLAVWTMFATKAYSLVKLDAKPFERFNDVFFGTRHKAVGVGILDTEYQITSMLAGKQIVIQSSAHTTDM